MRSVRSTTRTRRARPRRLVVVTVVALVATTTVACSGRTGGDGAVAAVPSTAFDVSSRTAPDLSGLPAVADRPTFVVDAPPPVVLRPGSPDAETAELESRRRAALPDGPRFDTRARSQNPDPARWIDLAVSIARRRTENPVNLSRSIGMVAVAMHDAVVNAATAGVVDDRRAPDGGAASTLPFDVVAGGAAYKVLSTQFPGAKDRYETLAASQRRASARSGDVWPTTYDAAFRFGRDVAAQVVGLRAADRTATGPTEPYVQPPGGSWEPTPGAYAPAQAPGAATWPTWNLSSPQEYRPSAPPSPGSDAFRAATDQVVAIKETLSDPQFEVAQFWAMGAGTSTVGGYWLQEVVVPIVESEAAEVQATVLAVVASAVADAGVAAWDAKYHYGLVRPVTAVRTSPDAAADPALARWRSTVPTPPHPSYVSGHSTYSSAAAVAIGGLFPALAERVASGAAEAGDSRVLGGIHYWFDNVEGLRLGGRVGAKALARFGLQADAELPLSKATLVSADTVPRDTESGSAGVRIDE